MDAITDHEEYFEPNPYDNLMDETTEFEDDYGPGNLHPVHLGDFFCGLRYKIVRKLGAGAFSTVWLARDRQ